jgi:ABC-type multidrug transport system ATPase subunit
MTPALSLQAVTRIFSARFALRDIHLEVAEGEALAVTGPNGSGKTTLLRLVATLLRPSSGTLRVFGRDPAEGRDTLRPRIGALFLESFLYGDLTVRENLHFYGTLLGISKPDPVISSWLDRLGIAPLGHEYVRHLSKGERQRVSFVRSILHDPDLLLWDEPTSGLDEAGRTLFRRIALELKGKKTILCVTHDRAPIEGWMDREICLENGRIR